MKLRDLAQNTRATCVVVCFHPDGNTSVKIIIITTTVVLYRASSSSPTPKRSKPSLGQT